MFLVDKGLSSRLICKFSFKWHVFRLKWLYSFTREQAVILGSGNAPSSSTFALMCCLRSRSRSLCLPAPSRRPNERWARRAIFRRNFRLRWDAWNHGTDASFKADVAVDSAVGLEKHWCGGRQNDNKRHWLREGMRKSYLWAEMKKNTLWKKKHRAKRRKIDKKINRNAKSTCENWNDRLR